MALEQKEFEFPDEKEVNGKELNESIEAKVGDDTDVEVEIEDDTPEQDRNAKPMPEEIVKELDDDDLSNYSERVKQRLAQMKKVWHDERRAKEAAAREREEAVRFAQAVAEENKRLKSTLSSGEESYVTVAKEAAQYELEVAKREYREAYDSGDTDKIIDAQQKMNSAQMRLTQVSNYQPQFKTSLQETETPVNMQPERPQIPKPDRKALAWQEKNDWFGSDEEMTSLALGLHEKLVRNGVDPTSDEYYESIDKTIRKRFPEYFGGDTLDEDKPAQRTKPSTVVAPATRSTAPKKVHLTKTQLALAKKLGLTPEQYARETIKLERQNG